jgi:hypothetical protein
MKIKFTFYDMQPSPRYFEKLDSTLKCTPVVDGLSIKSNKILTKMGYETWTIFDNKFLS